MYCLWFEAISYIYPTLERAARRPGTCSVFIFGLLDYHLANVITGYHEILEPREKPYVILRSRSGVVLGGINRCQLRSNDRTDIQMERRPHARQPLAAYFLPVW